MAAPRRDKSNDRQRVWLQTLHQNSGYLRRSLHCLQNNRSPVDQAKLKPQLISSATAGKILVDLVFRYDDDFISIEYQILNFGEKVTHPARYTEWFTQESPNIHQEMYDLASTGRTLGGSEMGQGHS